MEDIKEKFKVDVEKLRTLQVSVLKAIKTEGEKHLKYYHSTMSTFSHPALRIKTHDTRYYEEVIPIIVRILEEHGQLVKA